MEIWQYAVLGMLSIIVYLAVSIYERVKTIEDKLDRLTFQYEKDNFADKLNRLEDLIIVISENKNQLDSR